MATFDEARQKTLEHVRPLGIEFVAALDATGRAVAEDVRAPWDFPAWDNSAMDGYAVRAEDAQASARLRLVAYIPAGDSSPQSLLPGTAAKILTGAPLPAGADAVVPFEQAEDEGAVVAVRIAALPGAHVRRRGEDMRAGETVLRAGSVLGPAHVSWLASAGKLAVPVTRRARVAILSTGDELVAPGEALAPGKIYDGNSVALAAAVKQIGAEPSILGIARDERASLEGLLAEGLRADALITSAGVSMGDRDLVRRVLEGLQVRQVFFGVDVKPGRPTAFGVRKDTPVFSLPGNPVSALLAFEEFVRPALLRMMGHRSVSRPIAVALMQDPVFRKPGRVSLVRVRLERRGRELVATSAGRQDPGILRTLMEADGIAVVPGGEEELSPGSPVDVQLLRPGFE